MKRLLWADQVRILAISLVILVHAVSVGSATGSSSQLLKLIFSLAKTGVPLFIMLSGALLLPKKGSISVFIGQRLKRIILPWVFWALVFFLMTAAQAPDGLLQSISQFKAFMISEFTYLPMILSLYLLMPALQIIAQKGSKTTIWYLVMLWFLGISLLPQLRNSLAFPLRVDNGLVRQSINYSGYLFLGYLLRRTKHFTKKWKVLTLLIFVGSLITSWQFELNSYTSPLTIFSSAGLFFMVRHLNQRETTYQQASLREKWLIKLSQASYGVFLVHQFILRWLADQPSIQLATPLWNSLILFMGTLLTSYSLILTCRSGSKFLLKLKENYAT